MLVMKSRLAARSNSEGTSVGVVFRPIPHPEVNASETRAFEGVRLSFRMPEELHRRLKMEACRKGRSIKGTIEGWVREMTPAA
jgi:hypothetical protein